MRQVSYSSCSHLLFVVIHEEDGLSITDYSISSQQTHQQQKTEHSSSCLLFTSLITPTCHSDAASPSARETCYSTRIFPSHSRYNKPKRRQTTPSPDDSPCAFRDDHRLVTLIQHKEGWKRRRVNLLDLGDEKVL